jgi:integrase
MSGNSSRKRRPRKAADRPKKPYPDFPLSPHPSGKWQKKIRGRIFYFGNWARRVDGKLVRVEGDGWEDALKLYKAQADDLHAGRTPRVKADGLTVKELCNRFLYAKSHKVASGELGARMFQEYQETCELVAAAFGKERLVDDVAADDFQKLRAELAKRWGPVRLGNAVTRIKSIFKYGLENALLEKAPQFGSEFRQPSKATLRRHRAENGEKMLEAEQLRAMIEAAGVPLRAMILLGLNCGFGNHDVATLPLPAVDLGTGWIDFPRPKTGIPRRCPLWPETVVALKEAIAERPEPRHEAAGNLVFVTSRGRPWLVNGIANPVTVAARDLMKSAGAHRGGMGFYTLRHVFRTVADAAKDTVAIDTIMGHADPTMGGHYRERIEDGRLQAVAQVVHDWLFGKPTDEKGSDGEAEGKASDTVASEAPAEGERPGLRLYVG